MKTVILVCCLAFAGSLRKSLARRERGDGAGQIKTVGCKRPRRFDPKQACDVETNCRFGGKCRKVAELKRHGETLRFVLPLRLESRTARRGRGRSTSILEDMTRTGLLSGSRVCLCEFDCGRPEFSSTAQQEVCGSNGHTYESECHLGQDACRCQSQITISSIGPCENAREPGREVSTDVPDFQTVGRPAVILSDCDSTCSYGATCDSTGSCKCDIECGARALSYLCGIDGRTYTNKCHVKRAQCRYQTGIDILHSGPCTEDERLNKNDRKVLDDFQMSVSPCDSLDCDAAISDPLCGSDDISYPNECVLKHASCIKGQNIGVKYKEFCHQEFQGAIATRTTTVSMVSEPDEDDLCHGIICHHGAVCVEHAEYDFICSCEDICDRTTSNSPSDETWSYESLRALAALWPRASAFYRGADGAYDDGVDTTSTSSEKRILKDADHRHTFETSEAKIDPEIILLDEEKGVKSAWAEEADESFRMKFRMRRRNENSRQKYEAGGNRRRIRRSRRSIDAVRPLIQEVLCGTDGKTYKNECEMKTEGCYKKMRITIAHRGACRMEVLRPPTVYPTSTSTTTSATTSVLTQREEVIKSDEIKGFSLDVERTERNRRGRRKGQRRADGKNRNRKNKRRKSNVKDRSEQTRYSSPANITENATTIGNEGKIDYISDRDQEVTDIAPMKDIVPTHSTSKRVPLSVLDIADKEELTPESGDIPLKPNYGNSNPYFTRYPSQSGERTSSDKHGEEIFDSETTTIPNESTKFHDNRGREDEDVSLRDEDIALERASDFVEPTGHLEMRNEDVDVEFISPRPSEEGNKRKEDEEASLTTTTEDGVVADPQTINTTFNDTLSIVVPAEKDLDENSRNHSLSHAVHQRSEIPSLKQFKNLWATGTAHNVFKDKVQVVKNQNVSNSRSNRLKSNNSTSETSSKPKNEVNIVTLGLAIGFGQFSIVLILVAIFVYMKKRKKLKDLSEPGENPHEDTPAEQNKLKQTEVS